MSGNAIQIGPFIGGLNTFSDITSIADNELSVCENFELDLDGSLKSRPPIVDRGQTFPLGATGNINVLGYYYGTGGVPYLLASDGLSSTYYFNGTTWNLITNTFAATAMAQFDQKAWLVAPYTGAAAGSRKGGYWTPSGGFVVQNNMPEGDTVVAHKYRLWISGGRDALSNPTYVYYSNILGSPLGTWTASPDFVNIGAGDGQSVVRVVVYYNNLVIFRTNSIYSFQYTTDPKAGVISLLVPNIGLSSKHAVATWENFIYFIYDERAYEFVNNRAQQLNTKVPFVAGNRTGIFQPYTVSVFNNRVIFSFWDVMYVYGLRTRTWTTWKSTSRGTIGTIIAAATDTEFEEAVVFNSTVSPAGSPRTAKTLHITDATTTETESFVCTAQTKNYNYQVNAAYKRLFWWGVDAIFRGQVTGTAIPVTFNTAVAWSQISTYTWSQLYNFTWEQPTSPSTAVQTIRDTTGLSAVRKFVKFMKALRFRQIYYKLEFTTDGSISTAPVRLFALMTYVKVHERVSKTVT